ncbi:type VI secretion system baseplate subunit TssG [Alkalimonas amylolytica]|uniref:Type VI secretion system protein ImpH n=1 Tax=Alkalimonas amylolytica TaxID=152573 RepID=A0A1H3Z317_ALKAM|nr:type VI secretion system baseplate subunit TssG [Alkalimonas amylolytica]SEA18169.1 type VI secretion system protein ImpH [Alkalimonas amylolytica]
MSVWPVTINPVDMDFYQAVFAIEQQLGAEQKHWHGVGRDSFPRDELIRFKAVQNLGFPGNAITAVQQKACQDASLAAFEMVVSFFGLTGPSGVLPIHYSELVLERLKQKDPTMRDFFDLFNHRLISLFYRAWEKYRFACQYQARPGSIDPFSFVMQQLTGQESNTCLFYGGFYSRSVPSAQQLSLQLSHLLSADVEVMPLTGRWIHLARSEQSRLASLHQPDGQYGQLGRSSMLGSKVWDISSVVELCIQAESSVIQSLLPGKPGYLRMQQLLSHYLEPSMQCRVRLKARVADFPIASLNGRSQLGMGGVLMAADARNSSATHVSFRLTRKHDH